MVVRRAWSILLATFVTTNVASIDANALNAIRMVWQITGKFKEEITLKHAPLQDMTDEQLDTLIDSGLDFLKGGGKNTLGNKRFSSTN